MQNKLWQDWVILFATAWLFVSPFFLGFADESRAATWFALVASLILYVSASEALVVQDMLEEWVDLLVAFALALSPWFMGYTAHTVATLNALIVGIVVAACAASAYVRDLREAVHGHHWAAHA